MSYLNKPVFVCGHRKAGTTLLINLLDGIQNALVYPDDSGFFYMFYPKFMSEKISSEEKLFRINERIIHKNLGEVIKRQNVDEYIKLKLFVKQQKMSEIFINSKQEVNDLTDILTLFIESFRSAFYSESEPSFWIEKTTCSEIYAQELKKKFPLAKFINIVRDPRDNLASLLSGWDKRYQYFNADKNYLVKSMLERGHLCMQMAMDNQQAIGSDYLLVHYEKLVTDPEAELQIISDFLDIELCDILFEPSTFGYRWSGNNFDGTNFSGISSANIGRWEDRMSRDYAKLIEYHFKDLMSFFGYRLRFERGAAQAAASEFYKWSNFAPGAEVYD